MVARPRGNAQDIGRTVVSVAELVIDPAMMVRRRIAIHGERRTVSYRADFRTDPVVRKLVRLSITKALMALRVSCVLLAT